MICYNKKVVKVTRRKLFHIVPEVYYLGSRELRMHRVWGWRNR